MRVIKIELDFLIGPIIKDVFDTSKMEIVTGVSLIDNNNEINALNDEISTLYSSFYEYDNPCKLNKEKLLSLLEKLISLLNKINDGSFIVEDLASPILKNL